MTPRPLLPRPLLPRPDRHRWRRWLGAGLACLLVAGCADRPRRNPLDAAARDPLDLADPLRAVADDGAVRLHWDFTGFDDVDAVRLYRDDGTAIAVVERPPGDTTFVDTGVENDRRYRYHLALSVRGAGELAIAGQVMATPGPERGWVADASSGWVWRLTPDGRQGVFSRGRFAQLLGVAVDPLAGHVWVADGRGGLYRIDVDGQLRSVRTAFAPGGALELDGPSRRGWIADGEGVGVHGFAADAIGDSLDSLPADAVFAGDVLLAASPDGGVWVADRRAARVLRFADDGSRRNEWRDLTGVRAIAATPTCCAAWVLFDDGAALLRLDPTQAPLRLSSPVVGAVAVDVDEADVAWVAGDAGLAGVAADGTVVATVAGVPPAVRAVAAARGHVWVAGEQTLQKITVTGTPYRTELTGFGRIVALGVDPGR